MYDLQTPLSKLSLPVVSLYLEWNKENQINNSTQNVQKTHLANKPHDIFSEAQ